MARRFDDYDPTRLATAVKAGVFYSFSLRTGEADDLGVHDEDDQAQLRQGGRFDLAPWAELPRRKLADPPATHAQQVLEDASKRAPYLYIQLDLSGGEGGEEEFVATYSPEASATPRRITVVPT